MGQSAPRSSRTAARSFERGRDDLVFGYRESSLDELVILEGSFQLEEDDPRELARRMQKQWIVKKAAQPMGHQMRRLRVQEPSRRQRRRVDRTAGLKGTRIGGAVVSERHANFIIAEPEATSQDVLRLIDLIRGQVRDRLGDRFRIGNRDLVAHANRAIPTARRNRAASLVVRRTAAASCGRLIEKVLPPSPDTLVIDVGCGTGSQYWAPRRPLSLRWHRHLGRGDSRAKPRFPKVQFVHGRAPGDLGPLMQQARLVLLMDVLEHVDDDFAMLSELLAAAAPGAYFLLTVPADESLWSEHDESFGHYRRYDRARLQRVWTGLPVTTLLVSYFNARLLPLIRLVRARSRRRGHAAGQVGTDFWLPIAPVNSTLQAIFAGEGRRLVQVLEGRQASGYTAGSSLVALIRREPGAIALRTKPADLPPDHRPRV